MAFSVRAKRRSCVRDDAVPFPMTFIPNLSEYVAYASTVHNLAIAFPDTLTIITKKGLFNIC